MRIFLATVGTVGDVIPFARLAAALLARGHAVTVQSWPQFARWFPEGATFVPAGGAVDESELDRALDEALRAPSFGAQKQRFARMFYGLGDGPERARAAYEAARAACVGHDVAVVNVLDHATQLAVADAGIAWASYASRPPPALGEADPLNAGLDEALSDLFASVTGQRRFVRMFRDHSPRLAMSASSRALVPPWLAVDGVEVTGAWLAAPVPSALPADLAAFVDEAPTVFVTFGMMPDVFGRTAALFEAAAASGTRAVIQVIGSQPVPARVAGGIFVLRDRVAFDALVPRVAAVVHHGSVGTLHEVVRAGKPSFVVPHMGDQFFWARVLAERGLGPPPVPHATISVDALARGFSALRAFAPAAAALAPVIAAEDGVARAASLVEELS